MTSVAFDLIGGPDDRLSELFVRLFASASLGWIVPVRADHEPPAGLLQGERDVPGTAYTEYDGPPQTAKLAAALESGAELPPIWCTLSVRVPRGDRLQRTTLLRRDRGPVAIVEVQPRTLRLSFSGDPLLSTGDARWQLAAQLAREELEAILERMREAGTIVRPISR